MGTPGTPRPRIGDLLRAYGPRWVIRGDASGYTFQRKSVLPGRVTGPRYRVRNTIELARELQAKDRP